MATKVHMEALSPTMEEGQLVRWLKREGDAVQEGEILAEIETDKATMELVARGSGVLKGVSLQEGATAPVGQVIAYIAGEGEDVPAGDGGAPAAPAGDAKPADAKSEPADAKPEPADAKPKQPQKAEPKQRLGDDAGAQEERDQREQLVQAAAEGEPAAAPAGGARAQAGEGGGEGAAAGGRVKASPLARRLASEAGIELSAVSGSGPGGRITKRDVEQAASGGGAAGSSAGGAAKSEPAAAPYEGPDVEEVPVSQMRKTIAKRLVTSIGPVPTFYLTIEVDMMRLMDARERVNERLEKEKVKLSINDFIIKAVAAALSKHPEVNAAWAGDVIQRHHRVHIGVAVAVEDGLITPIVRDADRKAVRDIAAEVRELAGRAREKKLKPEEYTGATFSISNLGMFGIQEFTAIINPPEAAILAVGAVEEKVVAEDGQIEVRPRMRLTMSCDHRVVDGATGAKFLGTVRDYLEEPLMILA